MGAVSISYAGTERLGQENWSEVSGVIDVGGRWIKKSSSITLPEITSLATPLIIRVYPMVGAGTPSGAGKIVGIDNVRIDIGERPYSNG